MGRDRDQRKAVEARRCTENMRRLILEYRAHLEHLLRAEGLTLPQLRLLKAVKSQTGVSAAALARTCFVTPQTLQSVLSRAEREHWIVRAKSARNERILTASLTPAGEAILERGLQLAARVEETIWQRQSVRDLRDLNDLLEAGIRSLEHSAQDPNDEL